MAAGEQDRAGAKYDGAYLTIRELSDELGVATHILRFWETRFPQLKPLQRSGNRRYYRPADVELARTIDRLLNVEGYTIKGVRKLIHDHGLKAVIDGEGLATPTDAVGEDVRDRLRRIRDALAAALDEEALRA